MVQPRFYRYVTYLLILCLLGSDPKWGSLCTAHASCDVAWNYSTETTRITTFKYDFDGHLTQISSPEGYINYGYDLATGRHISTCTAHSEIHYDYDKLGRLEHVTVLTRNGQAVNPPEVTTYTYTAVGSRDSVTLPNGIVTKYLYDGLNRLTSMTHKLGTNLLASYTYQLHETGRRTNAVEILKIPDGEGGGYLTNMLSWAYDQMYRLTNEVSISTAPSNAGTFTNVYQYDQVGNRFSKTHYQGAETRIITGSFNANDHLKTEVMTYNGSLSETNLYGYDLNGSLIAKTNLSSSGTAVALYGYDLKNKLSSVADLSGTPTTNYFVYNDQGIRVRSGSGGSRKDYLVDPNNHTGYSQILEEFTLSYGSPQLSRSYVLGDDVLSQCGTGSATPQWLLYDGHGSTRQLADNAGAAAQRYNYDAYGITQSGTSSASPATDLLYCGEQYDSTLGMYNLRARFYDQSNGRFNAMDSFRGDEFDPQSLHKYNYAFADPVSQTDPSGCYTSGEQMSVSGVMGIVARALLPVLTRLYAWGVRSLITAVYNPALVMQYLQLVMAALTVSLIALETVAAIARTITENAMKNTAPIPSEDKLRGVVLEKVAAEKLGDIHLGGNVSTIDLYDAKGSKLAVSVKSYDLASDNIFYEKNMINSVTRDIRELRKLDSVGAFGTTTAGAPFRLQAGQAQFKMLVALVPEDKAFVLSSRSFLTAIRNAAMAVEEGTEEARGAVLVLPVPVKNWPGKR